ncbi:MAG: nucleoside-diphosphate kinase [Spirochaetia bacterium]|nr:nucleoside-diphosphate kinase [Spirochaetia bacterium]
MSIEKTLSIIKPDAVKKKTVGRIIAKLEENFDVLELRRLSLSRSDAEAFYAVHKARPFFKDLVDFMTSGPVVAMVLQGENAVERYRNLMGATDSTQAAPGTLRKEFGTDKQFNAVHGSDSADNAKIEIAFFFK